MALYNKTVQDYTKNYDKSNLMLTVILNIPIIPLEYIKKQNKYAEWMGK